MSSIYLAEFRSNAAADAAAILPRLLRSTVTRRDTLEFCRACRVRGIAGLFLDGTPEPLHRELRRSGHAALHALGRMREEDQATGRLFPFFDAIAGGDPACARGIAALARPTWNPEEEYEDDFVYVRFLMAHFFLDAARAACDALLERWHTVLEGAHDARFDVARALLERAGPDFDQALAGLLDAERAHHRRLSRAGALGQEIEATEAHLSVEGIALVRLARASGLPTRSDCWGVPSIALKELPAPLGDDWRNL